MISKIPIILPGKTPTKGWKEYQTRVMSDEELAFQMANNRTQAVAQICGAVSGNLEVIDIDEKHQPGISAAFLTALRTLLPDIYPTLGIVRTPSGGHHVKYFCPDAVIPGNRKLAYAEGSKEASIETRGEGGYVVAPPSPGYVIIQEGIPTISADIRSMIYGVAESFNTRVKVKRERKTKSHENRYDLNPFEDFDQSDAAEGILEEFGWSECGHNSNFIYFTRPGKNKGISASFIRDRGFYYVFTSSTELEPSTGYSPSRLLGVLKFNGDNKALYRYLIEKGYGKLKREVEDKIVRQVVERGGQAPANLSEQAAAAVETLKQVAQETYPYGIFWKTKEDSDEYKINRQRLLEVCHGLGLRTYQDTIYQIDGFRLNKLDNGAFISVVKDYIKEEESEVYDEIANAYEAFMEKSTKYTVSRLTQIEASEIERDTRERCRKFYDNGFLEITKDGFKLIPYVDYKGGLVKSDRFLGRDFIRHDGRSKYLDFLELATNFAIEPSPIRRAIGFLSHEFKDATTGYIVVLTEECADPRHGGGSGKNIFCQLLNNVTTYVNKNGSQSKFDEKFFQLWTGQRIMSISDVPRNFDYQFLKEPATGSFTYKRLWKDEEEVSVEDAPKFLIQTNFGVEISDGGLSRRIIQIEFTDFFTRAGGVDRYFGGAHFPKDWTAEDWGGFDTIVAESIQEWILGGCKMSPVALSDGGKVKQFEQTHGKVALGMMEECFDKWASAVNGVTSNEVMKYDYIKYYTDFDIEHRITKKRINDALDDWAKMKGYVFIKDHVYSAMGETKRGIKLSKR